MKQTRRVPGLTRRYLRDRRGVSALEYAILVGAIAVAMGTAVAAFGTSITAALTSIGGNIASTTSSTPNAN